jgi:hypothetical protein
VGCISLDSLYSNGLLNYLIHLEKFKMKKILLILGLLLFPQFALAQSPVITQPYNVTSYNASGTIAVTNTFQSIWTANTSMRGRAGCTVQNNGTNSMYVYFGPIASATTATSVKLAVGQSVNCNVNGITLQDQVSITGTSGEAYYAAQQ